jgi:hypothetical protein
VLYVNSVLFSVIHNSYLIPSLTGKFSERPKDTVVLKGERAEKVYHKDSTFFDGKFDETTTSKQDYRQFTGERAEIHRTKDNLKTEGKGRLKNIFSYTIWIAEA